jgi:hypothetical protein
MWRRRDRPWLGLAFALWTLLCIIYRHNNSHEAAWSRSAAVSAVSAVRLDLKPSVDSTAVVFSQLPTLPPSTFEFCTMPGVWISDKNDTMSVPYHCDGPLYRSFASLLHAAVQDFSNEKREQQEQPLWGHRTALPPGKRILMLGNSHTRQVATSLLCQLGVHGQVWHQRSLDPAHNANMARKFQLSNGAQLYLVVNSYVVHSPNWVKLLEVQIGVKLQDFDALVLGVFNTCDAPVNTTFATEMKDWSDNLDDVDCFNVDGPNLTDVAAVYFGPVVFVSMFAHYRYATYEPALEAAVELGQVRPNLLGVDARHYIESASLGECGSLDRTGLSDCVHNNTARRFAHRCVGPYGGHADLISWDVLEFLYEHLGEA